MIWASWPRFGTALQVCEHYYCPVGLDPSTSVRLYEIIDLLCMNIDIFRMGAFVI